MTGGPHLPRAPAGGPLSAGFASLTFSGVSRLTWLVDLFGELSVTGASVEEDGGAQRVKLTAQLLTEEQRYCVA